MLNRMRSAPLQRIQCRQQTAHRSQGAGFRPTIKVTTRDLGELVEVRVPDNGTGIPADVRE